MKRTLIAFVAALSCAPAMAKPHHHHGRHFARHHHWHHYAHHHHVRFARWQRNPWSYNVQPGFSFPQNAPTSFFSAGSSLISVASRYIGQGNFTRTGRAWCADALGAWLNRAGYHSTGSGLARSYARYGRPAAPHVGAIAVMPHHVGIVVGFKGGNPILLSGNHGHRVGVGTYSAHRIIAYRSPS